MEAQRTERTKERDWLFKEVKDLGGVRDELRLQAHLFKAELKAAFEALEKRWDELESKVEVFRGAPNADAELMDGLRAVLDEVKGQYRRFKKRVARES